MKGLKLALIAVVLLVLSAVGNGLESSFFVQHNNDFPQFIIATVQHEIFVGQPERPVLIICEENHASLEVQRNCQLAIKALVDAGIQAALLAEGTLPARIPLSVIFDLGVPEFRAAVAEAWFELGWLSGIELAALQNPSLPLFGVEDLDLKKDHADALNREGWAWYNLCKELDSLLHRLSDRISLDCAERSAQGLEFSEESESQFPQIAAASERAHQAEASFEQPVEGALPLEEAVGTLQRELSQGKSVRDALIALQRDFPGVRTTFSARFAEWEDALDALYDAIIETARQAGLDVSQAEKLQQAYQQRRIEADAARKARDRAMITNAQQNLNSVGFEVGFLSIGAAHIAQLKDLLREEGISYLVVTPEPSGLRLFTTPRRESEWFRRNSREEKPPTPLESWLGGGVKPELTLADPEKREALATDTALMRAIYRALRGGSPEIPPDLLIKSLRVRSIHEGIEITVEGVSGRRLLLQFPSGFDLTDTAAKQLVRHLMEALEASGYLMRRNDGFFSPATHLYVEPVEQGFRGGAFISYMPDANTLAVRATTFSFPQPLEELVEVYRTSLKTALVEIAGNPSKVLARQPTDLFAPLTILDPIVAALQNTLDELGVAENQIVPVALRLAPPEGRDVSPLREIDFTLLATLARLAGAEGYERRLMFVKAGLEPDSDRIREGGWERLLSTTLANIHRWAPTARHIAVFTIPTTEEEWRGNPFAEYLEGGGWTHEDYVRKILPYVQTAIDAIGRENVLEPRNRYEFLHLLEEKLKDVSDATVTLTLVAHRMEDQAPVIHFKREPKVPLEDVLEELERLQDEGRIPESAKLEFNVLVCSIGREGAEGFLKRLGARLVMASSHAIGLATNSVLLAHLATKIRQEGEPLYQAHYEAQEEILSKVLEKSPAELDAEGIRSLEMPGPMARKTGNKKPDVGAA